MAGDFIEKQPKRSLRTLFWLWFLLFSVVPLFVLTGYFLARYEEAINNELVQRLRDNSREIRVIFQEYENYLRNRGKAHADDASLVYYMSAGNATEVARNLMGGMRNPLSQHTSVFEQDGSHLVSVYRDAKGELASRKRMNIGLSDKVLAQMSDSLQLATVDSGRDRLQLLVLTKALTKSGKIVGYIEQVITIDRGFLENLKKRLNLEFLLFDQSNNLVQASHDDFSLYPKDYFADQISGDEKTIYELNIRDTPYGFITSPIQWGKDGFYVGIGASKARARQTIREVSYVILGVALVLLILLVVASVVAARTILKPLYSLLEATKLMHQSNRPVEVPVTSQTELGLVAESFNEMSRKVRHAREELELKVKELESAYEELKDAQAKLVHSAKMASLGQLVAGVAHELNNPIGFIYSNMTSLRDYSDRMMKVIEAAPKGAEELKRAKEESDYDYIVQDLPRLIQSCEEGARRTRDIVVGLRNFSRLEEAKLKKIKFDEALENTLQLLRGELKNRIEVHKDFQPVPEVTCYASQINQVFMNILSNAVQAIPEKGGTIWLSLSQVKRGEHKGKVQISVRDSGKGIPKEDLARIFDPFYTTKTVGEGTGLGLSISYGIVKKHGGEIVVKSEAGKGTEFSIFLPVEAAEDA